MRILSDWRDGLYKKNTAEVLELYRRRDVIGKSFDDPKNGVDMKRLHCHSNETVEGKTFVAFLALIVRAYMQNKLGPMMRQNSFPFRKILLELEKIRCLTMTPNANPTLLCPLTKLQRAIFEALETAPPKNDICDNSCGI